MCPDPQPPPWTASRRRPTWPGFAQVNFSLIGVMFMTVASCSDALRLVIAQKMLKNQKMGSFEGLACISPMCLLFMAPVAIFKVR